MSTINSTFGTTGLVSEVTLTLIVKSTNEGDQNYAFALRNTSQVNRVMGTLNLSTVLAGASGVSLSSGTKYVIGVPTTASANLRMTGSTAEAGITLSSVMPSFLPVASTATVSPLFYQVGGGSFVFRVMGL